MARTLSTIGALLSVFLLQVAAAQIPRPAPELAVPLPDGRQVLLSQYRGKVVLIEFVHTTCSHCQQASGTVERVYKDLGPRGFQPIAVAFNENAQALVPDFVRQLGLTFPVGWGNRDEVVSFLQFPLIQPMYVPQMVLVDRKGMIRAQYSPDPTKPSDPAGQFLSDLDKNLRTQVEALLKEPGPGATRRTRSAKPRAATAKPAKTASTAHP